MVWANARGPSLWIGIMRTAHQPPTILPGSPSHCLLASAPGSSPIPPVFPQVCSLQGVARHVLFTWAGVKDPSVTVCSQVSHVSLITGDKQSTTRFAAYPLLPCERGNGTGQIQQRRFSFAHNTRLFRLERLVVAWCRAGCMRPPCSSVDLSAKSVNSFISAGEG